MKLNLGSGNKRDPGYVNVDSYSSNNPDKVWDLNSFPYPWADNSIDAIRMRHVLEHLDDLIAVMNDVWRILKPKCRVDIEVPYVNHFQAIGHPQHKHFFHWGTFGWLDIIGKDRPGIERYTDRYFRIVHNKLVFDSEHKRFEAMFNAYPTIYNGSSLSKLFPAATLSVLLEKI